MGEGRQEGAVAMHAAGVGVQTASFKFFCDWQRQKWVW